MRDDAERTQRAIERAQAAHRRAAEVLTARAALADAHAMRAEAQGDGERAAFERDVARRVRATVARLGDDPASGPSDGASPGRSE
jgi:hypothetical protein